MGFKVFKTCCKNCLLTKDRIVSPERAKEIIQGCAKKQSHFICHKSDDVCCRNFYDKLGHTSQMIRTCDRMGWIEWVEQEDSPKLKTYEELKITTTK